MFDLLGRRVLRSSYIFPDLPVLLRYSLNCLCIFRIPLDKQKFFINLHISNALIWSNLIVMSADCFSQALAFDIMKRLPACDRGNFDLLAYKQTSTPLKIDCLYEHNVNQLRIKINKKFVLLHPSILNAPIVDEIIECH